MTDRQHHRDHRDDPSDLQGLRHSLLDAVPEPPHRIDTDQVLRLSAHRRGRKVSLALAGAAALAVVTATGVASDLLGDRTAQTAPAVSPMPSAAPVPAPTEPSGPEPSLPIPETDVLADVDLSEISTAQAAEIADRTATAEEYRAAFERYRDCIRAAGYELGDGYLDRGVYSVAIPVAAEAEEGLCYDREYQYTDTLWQLSPAIEDQSLATEIIRDCLQQRGFDPLPTRAELDDQLLKAGLNFGDCE